MPEKASDENYRLLSAYSVPGPTLTFPHLIPTTTLSDKCSDYSNVIHEQS